MSLSLGRDHYVRKCHFDFIAAMVICVSRTRHLAFEVLITAYMNFDLTFAYLVVMTLLLTMLSIHFHLYFYENDVYTAP